MGLFILALLAALLSLVTVRAFLHASPASLARFIRIAGGTATMSLAFISLVRGQYLLAIALAMAGIELASNMGLSGRLTGRKSAGRTSRVATARLEIDLDHDSGAITGRVLAGAFKDRPLASLTRADLLAVIAECGASDTQSAALLEAYLDRIDPDWRPAADGQADQATSTSATPSKSMTRAEAFRILGLEPGVTDDQIRHTWRELMKRNHPDQGGSAELAAMINRAKETLLRD